MNHSILTEPWLPYRVPRARAHLRLFCLPYAGGGASAYRAWGSEISPEIEILAVQLPGRENRFREPPLRSMSALVERLSVALRPYMDRPFAFFGHSMGALVAYELARALRRQGGPTPVHLVVSGREAPHVPSAHEAMHELSDDALVARLQRLGGTPPEALAQPALLQLVLPLLRADLEAHDTYAYRDDAPLDCPITAFGGLRDPEVRRDHLAAWQRHTRGGFALHSFPGDHFFIRQSQHAVLATLGKILRFVAPQRAVSGPRREPEL